MSLSFECWSPTLRQTGLTHVFPQLFQLAVGERIHRVDDNRPRARRFAGYSGFDRRVDDGNEQAERFARARPRRDNEALPRRRPSNRLGLMPVERHGLPVDTENAPGVRVDRRFANECVDRDISLEIRVQADERLRPELARRIDRLDLCPDIGGADLREGSRETRVVVHE